MQNFDSRAAAVCALICFSAACFAQSVQAPTPPEVPTVSVPSVSAPTLSAPALSAADISMLSNLFGSGNPLSLNALGGNTAAANATSFSASQGETAALLQAVLEKLDTLQKTVEQKSAESSSPPVR